jgi:hypothetical protein
MFSALPMTWIDGSTTKGSVVYPCKNDVGAAAHKGERENLKMQIAKMKKKGLG